MNAATIAEAVKNALNAQFSASFTAERKYWPEETLEQLETLDVAVVPRSLVQADVQRHGTGWNADIDVGLRQRIDTSDNTAADALVDLAQDIATFLRENPITVGGGSPDVVEVNQDSVFEALQFGDHHVFSSVVTVRYRFWTS